MLRSRLFACVLVLLVSTSAAQAVVHDLHFDGKAGLGLLSGNENHTINGTPGTGDEIGSGLTYDDVSNLLSMSFGWGSGNGFVDLTGTASAAHIHGPAVNPAPASYLETNGVLIDLPSLAGAAWNPSATSGSFGGSTTLTETQEGFLTSGRLYINVHTSANGGGEIRGQLIVPEPGSVMLLVAASSLLLRRRRA